MSPLILEQDKENVGYRSQEGIKELSSVSRHTNSLLSTIIG